MISGIAKQALLLNCVVFALIVTTVILWVTIILIPVAVLFWMLLSLAAIALPIIGAIKANQGAYYRYPVVGVMPS